MVSVPSSKKVQPKTYHTNVKHHTQNYVRRTAIQF
jgi:hypothetical protein